MAQAPPTFTPDSEFADLQTPRGPSSGSLSVSALARFEFEAGKGNEGTKILMIEWEDDDLSRSAAEGSWHVSWTGKTTVLPADERPSDSVRRFYFLLPPNTTIPPVVTLSYEHRPTTTENTTTTVSTPPSKTKDTFQLNPLPAIFPPELGATGRSAGKKGVLHTIWAKKRLRVLDREIREEFLNNAEGVALHMAIQEKEWIESNFGDISGAVDAVSRSHESSTSSSVYPMAPATPVSPVSGRKLSEKLKGLKLQTSEKDLSANDSPNSAHLLSPQSPDVAVSSFSSFRNVNRAMHSMPTPDTNPTPTPSTQIHPSEPNQLKPAVAHFPPQSLQEAQQDTTGVTGFAALAPTVREPMARTSSADSGEELFAKALSPRSPDLPRSPFSFA
ncbi:hypothetical protein N7474_008231 [Penicillium riverlandense]|uniref:uncharacterized protein n=1 Tax=Penicillium riverlandense TaxID=1903569 RepID=UPI002548E4B5|nr:uncharacterized protein N7474_008231 [Penicillium riverlandense]KAJ5811930.1 hypothetical protein N7474_008231 [Penicillium riverlandense]